MDGWQILSGVLAVLCLWLSWRLWRLRRAMCELGDEFAARLSEPTNTWIGISCQDKGLRRLAVFLNEQLKLLIRQRWRYEQREEKQRRARTNLSHDLRTPLTAICGYLDLLKRLPWIKEADCKESGISGEQAETAEYGVSAEEEIRISAAEARQAARYLALIEERTRAMKRMTEELFDYFVSADRQETARELSLNAVLEECLAGFYGAFNEKGIVPEITLPERPVRRRLPQDSLARIFDNILANAVKYGDKRLQVRLTPEGEICFANPARELSAVQVGRLFDRFFTVETGQDSTGLGLSIARLLTEQLGGRIRAQYEAGWLTIAVAFPKKEGQSCQKISGGF